MQFAKRFGQQTCPFGDAALQFRDALLAVETCEELFTPMSPNIQLALSGAQLSLQLVMCMFKARVQGSWKCSVQLSVTASAKRPRHVNQSTYCGCYTIGTHAGVDIIVNGSGSHHQLRKLDARLDLIRSATAKAGGVYVYANQRGCDGGRLYFDGCACALSNGQLLAQGGQFNLKVLFPPCRHCNVTLTPPARVWRQMKAPEATTLRESPCSLCVS